MDKELQNNSKLKLIIQNSLSFLIDYEKLSQFGLLNQQNIFLNRKKSSYIINMKVEIIPFIGTLQTILVFYLSFLLFATFQTKEIHSKYPSFDEFLLKFNKTYSSVQYTKRKQTYLQNIHLIQSSKCQACGANFFADWTTQEINNLRTVKKSIKRDKLGATASINHTTNNRLLTQTVPTSFDWRDHTNFTSVKHQGYCGASWAFSAAAFFEQDSIIDGIANQTINLSEQYLITCNRQNQKCNSGYIDTSMDLVMDVGGIPIENKYPFRPDADFFPQSYAPAMCFQTDIFKVPTKMRISYFDIKNQEVIKKTILKKPVNIGMCGSDLLFYYPSSSENSSRTLKCKSSNKIIDHSVLLVGYTQNQWIIKNQWGNDWGINGYAYISRKSSEDCCIGDQMHTSGSITQQCTVTNCKICVQTSSCYQCQKGYYVYHNTSTGVQTCEACVDENCAQCYNYYGYCRQCIDGYAINSSTGKCVNSTIANCNLIQTTTTSSTICNQCHRGYRLSSSGASCLVYCQLRSCIKCSEGPCTTCKTGYTLNNLTINGQNTQKCVLNPCYVANCTYCDINGACIQCYGALVLVNGTCNNNCNISGCISCVTGSTTCLQCVEGKSWNSTAKACQVYAAFPNCKTANKTTCTACKSGFAFNSVKTQCNQVCENTTCSNCSRADTGICLNCSSGYYLVSTTYQFYCVPYACDLLNCSLCSADGKTCVKCITTYHVWNSTANVCQIQCNIPNCQICLPTDTKCNTCNPGYAVIYQTGLCRQSNISKCPTIYVYSDGSYDCQICAKYYYPTNNWMTCAIYCTDLYCRDCKQQTLQVCQECFDGYSLQFKGGSLTCLWNKPEMPGCNLITANQTYCFECGDYYNWDPITGTCTPNTINCTQGCAYCTTPDVYSYKCVCANNYTFEYVQQICLPTNPLNNNCTVVSVYSSTTYCQECLPGDYVSDDWKYCNNPCIAQNCLQCYEGYNTQCVLCKGGYYVDINGICIQCSVSDCQICNGIRCMACKPGFLLNARGDKCTKIQCKPTFVLDGQECVCPASTYMSYDACLPCKQKNCLQCPDQNQCYQCKNGYYLSQSNCYSCTKFCKKCTSSTNCMQCQNGYFYQATSKSCLSLQDQGQAYIVQNNQIIQCPIGCIQCNSQSICSKCTSGFALGSDGTCAPCASNCLQCMSNFPSKCILCKSGYILLTNSCIACNDQNCLDCSSSINDCKSCLDGYYISNSTCVKCSQNYCTKCSLSDTCLECSEGFSLNSENKCVQCIGDCKHCNPQNLTQCLVSCQLGQYLADNVCLSCSNNCMSCQNYNLCYECKQTYVLRDKFCQKKCIQQSCYECDASNPQSCLRCFTGYFLSNNKCLPILSCNQNNNCTSCPIYWTLLSSNCVLCDVQATCIQCSNGAPQQCIQCIDGYYLSNKVCLKCQSQCIKCIDINKCKTCAVGYFLKSGQTEGTCQKCDQNCLTCEDQATKCTSCNTPLQLSSTKVCLSQEKVRSQIRIDCTKQQYQLKAQQIIYELQSKMGQKFKNRIHCKNIREGSVIADYETSVPPDQTVQTTFQKFSDVIQTMTSLAGISVISVQKIQIFIPPKPTPSITQKNSPKGQNTTIILAAVIPSAVVILVILSYIIKRRISAKNSIQNENQEIMREKQMLKQKQIQKVYIKPKLQPISADSPIKNLQKQSMSTNGYRTFSFNDTNLILNQNSHQKLGDEYQISREEGIQVIQIDDGNRFGQNNRNKREHSRVLPDNINDISQIIREEKIQNQSEIHNQNIFEQETLRKINNKDNAQNEVEIPKKIDVQVLRQGNGWIIQNYQAQRMQIRDFDQQGSQF